MRENGCLGLQPRAQPAMKLWTWHKPDFSLLEGRVDHEKSEYVLTVPRVREAYEKLVARIGTSRFIWCYTAPNQHIVLPRNRKVEWILNVPRDSILWLVDDIVWNRILGIRCALPSDVRHRWLNEALRRPPHDAIAPEQFIAQQEESFWTQPSPGESWWDCLFTQDHPRAGVSALVPHPVAPEWVLVNPLRKR